MLGFVLKPFGKHIRNGFPVNYGETMANGSVFLPGFSCTSGATAAQVA